MSDAVNNSLKDNKYAQVSTCIVCCVVIVFGLIGNFRVCTDVLRRKSKWTVTNVFVFNLAVANILISSFVVPSYVVHVFVDSWPFGWFMCRLWPCIYYTVCYASILTLASMAQMRYWFTVRSLEESMSRKTLIISVVVIWLVSIALSLPQGIYATQHNRYGNIYCHIIWPDIAVIRNYVITTLVVMLCLPLIFIAYWLSSMSMRLSRMSTADNAIKIADRSRRNRLLITLFAAIVMCWLPFHIINVLSATQWEINQWKYIQLILRVLQAMAVSSTCFTPLFYTWINKINVTQFYLVGPCFNHRSHQSNNLNSPKP